jgi:hypothetical protein
LTKENQTSSELRLNAVGWTLDRFSFIAVSETVYIETSILGYLTARPSRDIVVAANIEITREWWNIRRKDFQLYSSQAVVKETSQGDTAIASPLLFLENAIIFINCDCLNNIPKCDHFYKLRLFLYRLNNIPKCDRFYKLRLFLYRLNNIPKCDRFYKLRLSKQYPEMRSFL